MLSRLRSRKQLENAIRLALQKDGATSERLIVEQDPIYKTLREADGFVTFRMVAKRTGLEFDASEFERRIAMLGRDFKNQKFQEEEIL